MRTGGLEARALAAFAASVGAAAALWLVPGAALAQDTVPPGIVHEPCEFYAKNGNFEVRARFYDDSPIFDPKVLYRTRSRKWRSVSFKKEASSPDFVAVIKKKQLKGVLEYFIEVFDENGNGPARFGSPEAPVRVRPIKKLAEACRQIPDSAEDPLMAEATGQPGGGASAGATGATAADAGDAADAGATGEPAASPELANADAGAPGEGTPPPTEGPQVIAINLPPPPPAQQGCAADDAPLYCSPILWTIVGGVVVAGAATGIGIYVATEGGRTGGPGPTGGVPDRFTLRISGPDPTGAP